MSSSLTSTLANTSPKGEALANANASANSSTIAKTFVETSKNSKRQKRTRGNTSQNDVHHVGSVISATTHASSSVLRANHAQTKGLQFRRSRAFARTHMHEQASGKVYSLPYEHVSGMLNCVLAEQSPTATRGTSTRHAGACGDSTFTCYILPCHPCPRGCQEKKDCRAICA